MGSKPLALVLDSLQQSSTQVQGFDRAATSGIDSSGWPCIPSIEAQRRVLGERCPKRGILGRCAGGSDWASFDSKNSEAMSESELA